MEGRRYEDGGCADDLAEKEDMEGRRRHEPPLPGSDQEDGDPCQRGDDGRSEGDCGLRECIPFRVPQATSHPQYIGDGARCAMIVRY
jgi:hypothetical protein